MIGLIFGFITLLLSFYLATANIKRVLTLFASIIITITCCVISIYSFITMQAYFNVMDQIKTIDVIDYQKMPKEYDFEIIKYNSMLKKAKQSVATDPYAFMKYQRDTIDRLDYIQVNERN